MTKDEEGYILNGTPVFSSRISGALSRFSSIPTDKRVRAGILLALLIVSMPVAAQVLAQFFNVASNQPEVPAVPAVINPPTVLGNFTMTLNVQNVNNLCAWEVAITFNPEEIRVLSVAPGVFPESKYYPEMLTSMDNDHGLLTTGEFLVRGEGGWSGSGTLSTIVFGYFADGYSLPKISMEASQPTLLLDSAGNSIPLGQQTTLSLSLP